VVEAVEVVKAVAVVVGHLVGGTFLVGHLLGMHLVGRSAVE
jgi:hypothetical protein